jgi:vacuolar protein-sorting-associated protein 4
MPQFKDVIGYEKEKDLMREIIILPQKFPHLFTGGRSPFRTVLLFGPSGCGTSFFIKSVAREANVTLFYLDGEKAPSNWDRRGEKLMDAVFRVAAYLTPSVIYLNNIDNYAFTRYSMLKTEFILSVHNHIKRGVTLIAGSNNPDAIDMAVRRRLEKRVWMKLPDLTTRRKLIERYLSNNELSENDIMTVAERVEGFTHRDIVETILNVSKKYKNITVEHILDECSICKRTDEKVFAEWFRQYGSEY